MNMKIGKLCVAGILLLLLFGRCSKEKQLFEKLDAVDAGISFENKLAPTEDFNIIDYLYFYNGGGVAVGDINGDSLPEIFLSGNQVKNRLYLNKGNLKFEDITAKAGVEGNASWNTGSVMADINNDGLLDIYVCSVVGLKNLRGYNELYINNGDGTFTERAADFGLDFDSYSSTAAFLDYDRDGDLDMYLVNHAVHTPESFGHAKQRNAKSYESGDKLLRNDSGKFIDVSDTAKIYGGSIGYGLGIAVSDFNVDGFPDIYVGNDFHEDDYYYINNGDGTFREEGKRAFTQTSKFSMGLDVADINHDGLPDLMTLDMLPEDEAVLKRSESDDNINILRMRTVEYGYSYQFQRNMLQINQGNGKFAETALLSNVAATDWSWSALFSDFDMDGHQDLFISNGIPKRPNDLDYMKYVSSEQVVSKITTTKLVDQKALSLMPSGKVQNYVFQGSGNYEFKDKSKDWLPDELTCSTASALADLDNDGDLDIVVNNVDDKPGIYVNKTDGDGNFLKIRLKYSEKNPFGIGTRVQSYHDGILQVKELYTVRGFQASSEPLIHFGYGKTAVADSIIVIWPDGSSRKLQNVKTNQTLAVSAAGNQTAETKVRPKASHLFSKIDPASIGLSFTHTEDPYTDLNRLKLLPYQQSDRGPATAVGDLNNDGKPDVYFGGSKRVASQIFLQSEKGFVKEKNPEILNDSISEVVDAVIADFNNDGKADLFAGTGGADFYGIAKPLLDVYYKAESGKFTPVQVPNYYENASCVKPFDFDGDGDLDLFVGNESVSNDFGKMPKSYLLRNENGALTAFQSEVFENLGMVTDAVWEDFNKDGKVDLVVVGEWMEPVFLRNDGSNFVKEAVLTQNLKGLWQSIGAFDIDDDGDKDFVVGNWGLNSKFNASNEFPLKMYYNDFDQNGQFETVVAIEKNGDYYPLDAFDMLAGQIVSLKKKYTSYVSFAGQPIEEIFSNQQLSESMVYEVNQLASGYLKNDAGKFTFTQLPVELQFAPIMAQLKYDFDADGREELLLAGNYFGVQPFHGRFGSFGGAVIKNEKKIISGVDAGLDLINGSVRNLNVISFDDKKYLLVTLNNQECQVYKLSNEK